MLDIDDVIHWLREGEDWRAADVLSQCDFSYDFVDLGIVLGGGPDVEIYDLKIGAPRRVINRASDDLQESVAMIEKAISECSESLNVAIRKISWVPKLRTASSSPSDTETEAVMAAVDSDHVKSGWSKALGRRSHDPDGAITAAKTLIESVCKHILNEAGVSHPPNPDLPKLYQMVASELNLAPDQHIDKNIKRVLGSCQAVVGGIAFLRNHLGDAHSPEPGATAPSPADAELAVNLAGAIATYMVRAWENQRERSESTRANTLPASAQSERSI